MPLVQKPFGDIITFTRASTATYFDATGTLQSAAIDVPRFDYDPATLAARGFLIEEARTNSIRNNTMQGAAAGTPGTLPTNWVQSALASGLTANVLGTGTSSGINYIDIRISGTTADTTGWSVFTDANTQIAASSGQVWTGSSYVAIIGGSTANIAAGFVRVAERNSGGGYVSESNISWATATSVLANNRFSVTKTLGATAAFVQSGVYFQANSGVAIDITLRIGLPQLELGAFATSVIPTTTTALTRSDDVASVNTLSPWFNASEGTIYADFSVSYDASASLFPLIASFDDNTTPNRIVTTTRTIDDRAVFSVVSGGVSQASLISTNFITYGVAARIASAYAVGDAAIALNGVLGGLGTPAVIPSGMLYMRLGNAITGGVSYNNILNGHLRRVAYYPRRLSNAELQGITA